jgi:hypothetical protein
MTMISAVKIRHSVVFFPTPVAAARSAAGKTISCDD